MVHEKFFNINGKKYGPYLYQNKRVGGKVVTTYISRDSVIKEKVISFLILLLLAGALILLLTYRHSMPMANVILDSNNLSASYVLPESKKSMAFQIPEQIKNIPLIKISPEGIFALNVSEYFSYADSFSFEGANINAYSLSGIVILTPERGFRGITRGKITAYNGENNAESNDFSIVVSDGSVEFEPVDGKIKVGEMVKWKASVDVNGNENLVFSVPSSAGNASIIKSESGEKKQVNIIDSNDSNGRTRNNFFGKLYFSITGNAVYQHLSASEEYKYIPLPRESGLYSVEYYTVAPSAKEIASSRGKEVEITGPEDVTYTDVTASADVENIIPIDREDLIKLQWKNNNGKKIPFDSYDSDGDGNINYIEWTVPHLSKQIFEVIYISKAEHLNENLEIIDDVYDDVRARDDTFTSIPDGHYLRVTFDTNLTSSNDITIYARGNHSSIEVHKNNNLEKVAEFKDVSEYNRYRVLLTDMQGSSKTFDLKVIGGIDFDYVVDPALSITFVSPSPNEGQNTIENVTLNATVQDDSNKTYAFFTDGILAWYRFDNSSSVGENNSFIYDWGTFRNNATLTDDGGSDYGAFPNSTGRFGGSFYFGNDSAGQIDDYLSVNPQGRFSTDDYTVSAWVKTNSTSSQGVFASGATNGVVRYGLYLNLGKPRCFSSLDSVDLTFSSYNLADDVWHQVACVRNRANNRIEFYFDGILGGVSGALDSSAYSFGESYSRAVIGATLEGYQNAPFEYLNGSIDELLLFNRALNESEIFSLYNSSQRGIVRSLYGIYGSKNYTINTINSSGTRVIASRSFLAPATTSVGIISPANTTYSSLPIYFNFSLGLAGSVVKYSLDSGIINNSASTTDTFNYNASNSSIVDGAYNLNVYVNFTDGTRNDGSRAGFRVSQFPPSASFISPSPDSGSSTGSSVVLNASVSDESNVTYALFTTGLLNWYRFDNEMRVGESSGLVYDWSGKGHSGIPLGSPLINMYGGKFGGIYQFDGADDKINISDGGAYSAGSFSLLAWINSTSFTASGRMSIFSATGGGQKYFIALNYSAGDPEIYDVECGSSLDNLSSNARDSYVLDNMNDGDRHQVACVRNRETHTFSWYVDGVKTRNITTTSNDSYSISSWVYAGSNGTAEYFNGSIDELAVFNRPLEDSEIRGFYNSSQYKVSRTANDLSGSQEHFIKVVDSSGNLYSTTLTFNAPSSSSSSSSGGSGGSSQAPNATSIPEGAGCYDSDGGLNYYYSGTASSNDGNGAITSRSDFCVNNDFLSEYSCTNGQITSASYDCHGWCRNGACQILSSQTQSSKSENVFIAGKKDNVEVFQSGGGSAVQNAFKESKVCGVYSRGVPEVAFASSTVSGYASINTIDGDLNSGWYGTYDSEYPKWVTFDFGEQKCVRAVDVYVSVWDLPVVFDVQISNDGKKWDTVLHDVSVKNPRAIGLGFPNAAVARYIRIYEKSGERPFGNLQEIKVLMADYKP